VTNPHIYDREHDSWQTATTRLPDGSEVVSSPGSETEAIDLGFDGAWDMCKWHDITHLRLCQALGLQTSPTLMRIAHGDDATHADDNLVAYEEAMVEAAARFYNYWRKHRG
jgi:hypothetical protein